MWCIKGNLEGTKWVHLLLNRDLFGKHNRTKYSLEDTRDNESNLSPFQGGVDLPLVKILLNVAGKDLLLLTVTDTIPKGARVNVVDLIDALNPVK